jgi:hypothetical protein
VSGEAALGTEELEVSLVDEVFAADSWLDSLAGL